jgi:hypothetical protein
MPTKKSTTKKVKPEVIPPLLTLVEQQALNAEIRLDNLSRKKNGQSYGKSFAVVDMKRGSKRLDPNLVGLGDRSKETIHQLSVQDRIQGAYDLFKTCTPLESRAKDPFTWNDRDKEQASFEKVIRMIHRDGINSEDLPELQKKVRKKIEQEKDYLNSYYGHYGTILPEYDQYEPYTMLDTEAYLMRAIKRQHSLMFRQGFKIEGESHRFTRYINSRLNTIGYMMGMTVESFLKDILENLLIISNCFLLKIRDEDSSSGYSNPKNSERVPVAAYMIIPPHSVFPFVNQKGEIIKWRRYYGSARKYKDYKLEDVIHFKWDVKPGHVYGTPRTVSVRDDIFALRRLEENVEMLLINHLFPLFHVKVGTKEAPAQMLVDGITEVDLIKAELENMPKEGVFVTDERVEVDVIGIKGEAPDPKDIMDHYKARIFTGLGVSSIDMGETDTGNRATAENVSQNLKDQVKSDLNWFCGQFKHYIVQEMFEENNEPLSVQRAILDVNLVFPDVDVDGHIKWENHVIEKFNNHLITENEARRQTGMIPFNKQQAKMTHYELHVKDLQQEGIKLKNKGMIEAMAVRGEVAAGGSDPEGKSKKIKISKSSSSAASVTNKNRPTNQHGSNMDPHSARSSMDPNLIYDLLEQEMVRLKAEDKLNSAGWGKASGAVIDKYVETCMREAPQDYYTNQEQMEIETFRQLAKDRVAQTRDLDIIFELLNDLVEQYFEEPDAEEFTENSRTEDEPVERESGSSSD